MNVICRNTQQATHQPQWHQIKRNENAYENGNKRSTNKESGNSNTQKKQKTKKTRKILQTSNAPDNSHYLIHASCSYFVIQLLNNEIILMAAITTTKWSFITPE